MRLPLGSATMLCEWADAHCFYKITVLPSPYMSHEHMQKWFLIDSPRHNSIIGTINMYAVVFHNTITKQRLKGMLA